MYRASNTHFERKARQEHCGGAQCVVGLLATLDV